MLENRQNLFRTVISTVQYFVDNLVFQTLHSYRSNNLSLKNQRFILSGFKDIRIITFEFVANPQFLLFIKKSAFFLQIQIFYFYSYNI